MKGVYFGIGMGKGASTPAPDSWSSTLAVSNISDGNIPTISDGDAIAFIESGNTAYLSPPTLSADITLALPAITGTLALTSQITSLATADQVIDANTRLVNLNGDLSTNKLRFENDSGDLILELRGDRRVFAGDGSNCWFGQGTGAKHTTGYQNVLFGASVGGGLSSGYMNTAMGSQALFSATSAYLNTAIGRYAMRGAVNNNVFNNTSIGSSSMQGITVGNANVAVGHNAALNYGAVPATCTSMTDGTFIGVGTRPLANAGSNETAIGRDTLGHGSDTVTIGNDDIKGTWLKGAVVISEYTVSGVPTAATYQAGIIMVTDETGGYTMAFSDGTNWRRVQDRAIVS
jgi:hypothetical protein